MSPDNDDRPWLNKTKEAWEVNIHTGTKLIVNCGVNQTIEIEKLFGPLAAFGVRVTLEYNGDKSYWVVEREKAKGIDTEWVEVARWDCQLDWFDEEVEVEDL